jgi:hypothetical protein
MLLENKTDLQAKLLLIKELPKLVLWITLFLSMESKLEEIAFKLTVQGLELLLEMSKLL